MSDTITLTLRNGGDRPLDASCIAPDRLATLGKREIAALEVWPDGEGPQPLGELFTITGTGTTRVRVDGNLRLVAGLGTGMHAGELSLEGDVGPGTGSRMTGGRINVAGSAGGDTGLEMRGGAIVVAGNAGANLGGASPGATRGMAGGEIIVLGQAGPEAGARVRRGLIFVGGDADVYAGRGMIAGTLVVAGRAGRGAGQWLKRGSVVVLGGLEPPASYQFACIYRPPHLGLALTRLRAQYQAPLTDRQITGRYRRYSGDLAEVGKGEILEWTGE